MDTLKRFRVFAVRLTLGATALIAVVLWKWVDVSAASGLLLGGIAGTLEFWLNARRVERLANTDPLMLQSSVYVSTVFRFLIYGASLYKAYTLAPQTLYGLYGAIAGLFIIRAAVLFLGLTGLDQEREK